MPVRMEDVAARAGVSRALVSLVMRGAPHVSDARRAAVLAAADELGYRPNLIARRLASARTNTIGVLLFDLHNPLYADGLDRLNAAATSRGYQLLLASTFRRPELEVDGVHFLQDHDVDGVMLLGPTLGPKAIQELAASGPLVVVGRQVPNVDAVSTDDAAGTRLVMQHLLGLGHTRIAHIDGGHGAGAQPRRAAYRKIMTGRGFEPIVAAGDFSEEGGRLATRRLLDSANRPTAIFAANDLSAIGALYEARRAGLAVPRDLSVIGFDDLPLSGTAYLSLTTVRQPVAEITSVAVELLLERTEGNPTQPRHVLCAPSLVPRDTSAAPSRLPT